MVPLRFAARHQGERNAIAAFDKPVSGTVGEADGQEYAEAANAALVYGGFDVGAPAGGHGIVLRCRIFVDQFHARVGNFQRNLHRSIAVPVVPVGHGIGEQFLDNKRQFVAILAAESGRFTEFVDQ